MFPNLSAPGAVSVIIVSNFGSFVEESMIPERMTWKASPRYKAEQDGHRSLMREPHRLSCSENRTSPVLVSVEVRYNLMGCAHVPTPVFGDGLALMAGNSESVATSVSKADSGGITARLFALVLDSDCLKRGC